MSHFNQELFLSMIWFICGILVSTFFVTLYCFIKQQREIYDQQNQMNNMNTNNNRENTNTNRVQNQFIDYVAEIELNSVENATKTVYSYEVPDGPSVVIITDP